MSFNEGGPEPEARLTVEEQERRSACRVRDSIQRQNALINEALAKTTALFDANLTRAEELRRTVLAAHDKGLGQAMDQLAIMQETVARERRG